VFSKAVLVGLLLEVSCFSPQNVSAEEDVYGMCGAGFGGGNDAFNLFIEAGRYWGRDPVANKVKFLFCFGGAISATNESREDAIGGTIPHDDYTSSTYRNDGPEIELYLRGGRQIAGPVLFTGILGLAVQRTIQYSVSNVTGWYWEGSKDKHVYGVLGAGAYFTMSKKMGLFVDYTTRRGVGLALAIHI
jgi:hypothetical protein